MAVKATRLIPAVLAGTLLFAACGAESASNTASEPPVSAAEPEVAATEAPESDPPAVAAAAPEADTETAVDEPAPAVSAAAEPAAAEPAADPVEAAPVVVPASLQFSAPLVGGGNLDATTLAGKPTVFWFWAPN